MTSSGPDRSITSMSLPQWMKSKISDRYDLEQTPFSPPSTDDGFFLVRYKKAAPEQAEPPKVTTSMYSPNPVKQNFDERPIQSELNQHTTSSCKNFIQHAKIAPREIGMRPGVDSPLSRIKSTATAEDGLKGEPGSSRGYSVVAVAHQMFAAERSGDRLSAPPMNQRIRRNSKSLPASPQGSPKLLRKNPYFTNIIFGSTECVDNNETSSSLIRGSVEDLGNWTAVNRTFNDGDSTTTTSTSITSATTSNSKLQQQQYPQQQLPSQLSRQLFTPSPPTPAPASNLGPVVTLKAKPSHLREMNFWSPTSM